MSSARDSYDWDDKVGADECDAGPEGQHFLEGPSNARPPASTSGHEGEEKRGKIHPYSGDARWKTGAYYFKGGVACNMAPGRRRRETAAIIGRRGGGEGEQMNYDEINASSSVGGASSSATLHQAEQGANSLSHDDEFPRRRDEADAGVSVEALDDRADHDAQRYYGQHSYYRRRVASGRPPPPHAHNNDQYYRYLPAGPGGAPPPAAFSSKGPPRPQPHYATPWPPGRAPQSQSVRRPPFQQQHYHYDDHFYHEADHWGADADEHHAYGDEELEHDEHDHAYDQYADAEDGDAAEPVDVEGGNLNQGGSPDEAEWPPQREPNVIMTAAGPMVPLADALPLLMQQKGGKPHRGGGAYDYRSAPYGYNAVQKGGNGKVGKGKSKLHGPAYSAQRPPYNPRAGHSQYRPSLGSRPLPRHASGTATLDDGHPPRPPADEFHDDDELQQRRDRGDLFRSDRKSTSSSARRGPAEALNKEEKILALEDANPVGQQLTEMQALLEQFQKRDAEREQRESAREKELQRLREQLASGGDGGSKVVGSRSVNNTAQEAQDQAKSVHHGSAPPRAGEEVGRAGSCKRATTSAAVIEIDEDLHDVELVEVVETVTGSGRDVIGSTAGPAAQNFYDPQASGDSAHPTRSEARDAPLVEGPPTKRQKYVIDSGMTVLVDDDAEGAVLGLGLAPENNSAHLSCATTGTPTAAPPTRLTVAERQALRSQTAAAAAVKSVIEDHVAETVGLDAVTPKQRSEGVASIERLYAEHAKVRPDQVSAETLRTMGAATGEGEKSWEEIQRMRKETEKRRQREATEREKMALEDYDAEEPEEDPDAHLRVKPEELEMFARDVDEAPPTDPDDLAEFFMMSTSEVGIAKSQPAEVVVVELEGEEVPPQDIRSDPPPEPTTAIQASSLAPPAPPATATSAAAHQDQDAADTATASARVVGNVGHPNNAMAAQTSSSASSSPREESEQRGLSKDSVEKYRRLLQEKKKALAKERAAAAEKEKQIHEEQQKNQGKDKEAPVAPVATSTANKNNTPGGAPPPIQEKSTHHIGLAGGVQQAQTSVAYQGPSPAAESAPATAIAAEPVLALPGAKNAAAARPTEVQGGNTSTPASSAPAAPSKANKKPALSEAELVQRMMKNKEQQSAAQPKKNPIAIPNPFTAKTTTLPPSAVPAAHSKGKGKTERQADAPRAVGRGGEIMGNMGTDFISGGDPASGDEAALASAARMPAEERERRPQRQRRHYVGRGLPEDSDGDSSSDVSSEALAQNLVKKEDEFQLPAQPTEFRDPTTDPATHGPNSHEHASIQGGKSKGGKGKGMPAKGKLYSKDGKAMPVASPGSKPAWWEAGMRATRNTYTGVESTMYTSNLEGDPDPGAMPPRASYGELNWDAAQKYADHHYGEIGGEDEDDAAYGPTYHEHQEGPLPTGAGELTKPVSQNVLEEQPDGTRVLVVAANASFSSNDKWALRARREYLHLHPKQDSAEEKKARRARKKKRRARRLMGLPSDSSGEEEQRKKQEQAEKEKQNPKPLFEHYAPPPGGGKGRGQGVLGGAAPSGSDGISQPFEADVGRQGGKHRQHGKNRGGKEKERWPGRDTDFLNEPVISDEYNLGPIEIIKQQPAPPALKTEFGGRQVSSNVGGDGSYEIVAHGYSFDHDDAAGRRQPSTNLSRQVSAVSSVEDSSHALLKHPHDFRGGPSLSGAGRARGKGIKGRQGIASLHDHDNFPQPFVTTLGAPVLLPVSSRAQNSARTEDHAGAGKLDSTAPHGTAATAARGTKTSAFATGKPKRLLDTNEFDVDSDENPANSPTTATGFQAAAADASFEQQSGNLLAAENQLNTRAALEHLGVLGPTRATYEQRRREALIKFRAADHLPPLLTRPQLEKMVFLLHLMKVLFFDVPGLLICPEELLEKTASVQQMKAKIKGWRRKGLKDICLYYPEFFVSVVTKAATSAPGVPLIGLAEKCRRNLLRANSWMLDAEAADFDETLARLMNGNSQAGKAPDAAVAADPDDDLDIYGDLKAPPALSTALSVVGATSTSTSSPLSNTFEAKRFLVAGMREERASASSGSFDGHGGTNSNHKLPSDEEVDNFPLGADASSWKKMDDLELFYQYEEDVRRLHMTKEGVSTIPTIGNAFLSTADDVRLQKMCPFLSAELHKKIRRVDWLSELETKAKDYGLVETHPTVREFTHLADEEISRKNEHRSAEILSASSLQAMKQGILERHGKPRWQLLQKLAMVTSKSGTIIEKGENAKGKTYQVEVSKLKHCFSDWKRYFKVCDLDAVSLLAVLREHSALFFHRKGQHFVCMTLCGIQLLLEKDAIEVNGHALGAAANK